MLQKLNIKNYAIIDNLEINFSKSLNIITGETGAGKSILMGALNLILGQRADSTVLRNNSEKCVVESVFKMPDSAEINNFLTGHDLDVNDQILIRREILTNGKSRGFINDTPANLSQLKELGNLIVDLHQQFDVVELGNEQFQRQVLDALADNGSLLKNLKLQFAAFSAVRYKLEELHSQQATADKELDYNKFLFEELDELRLTENELEELESEVKLMSHAEQIKQQLQTVYFELNSSEQPLVQQLKNMQNKLLAVTQYHPQLDELVQRINVASIDLQDVADELESIDSNILYDAEKIETANERLSAGYRLFKKHGVSNTASLISLRDSLSEKLKSVLNIAEEINITVAKSESLLKACMDIGKKISANRKAQVPTFTEKVNKLLMQVGMPNARLKVQLTESTINPNGIDEISFLFDANKSNRFEPLSKVASGGELSRLMLSIKSLVASKLELPTLIFDEIDTGISGEAARQVGIIMKSLSAAHQLIVISHQPQIAAKASAHYFVYKQNVNNKIATSIRLLDNEERIHTIAQMLGGEKPSPAALANAREMVTS